VGGGFLRRIAWKDKVMKVRGLLRFGWLRNWVPRLLEEYRNWRVRRAW